MFSILKNSKKKDFYTFYFISFEKIKDNIFFENLKKIYPFFEVKFLIVNKLSRKVAQFSKLAHTPSYISNSTYLRLFLPQILPKTIKKFLYLDLDVIVNCDLSNVFSIDLGNKSLGAAIDLWAPSSLTLKKYIGKKYFNAGILLFDMEKFSRKLIFPFIKNKHILKKILFGDQDIINIVFKNDIYELPLNFNIQRAFMEKKQKNLFNEFIFLEKKHLNKIFKNVKKSWKSNSILHFCGPEKPWNNDLSFINKKYLKIYFQNKKELKNLLFKFKNQK